MLSLTADATMGSANARGEEMAEVGVDVRVGPLYGAFCVDVQASGLGALTAVDGTPKHSMSVVG